MAAPASSAARPKPQQTALAPGPEGAIVKAYGWVAMTGEQVALSIRQVQESFCKDAKPEEAFDFIQFCHGLRVNPWRGQAWLVQREPGRTPRSQPVKMVHYEVFKALANLSRQMDGEEFVPADGPRILRDAPVVNLGKGVSSPEMRWTLRVYRKDQSRPTTITRTLSQLVRMNGGAEKVGALARRDPSFWLEKTLIAHAYRRAAPEGIGPIYIAAEFGLELPGAEAGIAVTTKKDEAGEEPPPEAEEAEFTQAESEPEASAEPQQAAGEPTGERPDSYPAQEPSDAVAGSQRAQTPPSEASAEGEEWASCPKCGGPMEERTVKATGHKFLSCVSFPKCRGSAEIPKLRPPAAQGGQPQPEAPREEELGPDEEQMAAMTALLEGFFELGMSVAPPNGYDKAPRRGIAEWIAAKSKQLAALRAANAETGA